MKRRNFLSGLMAAPLAVKARLARFFARKHPPVEPCGAPILGGFALGDFVIGDSDYRALERGLGADVDAALRAGDLAKVAATFASFKSDFQPDRSHLAHCSLLRGHKGQHMLLNPR